jgi:hypothetical protein
MKALVGLMLIAAGISGCATVDAGPARPADPLASDFRAEAERVIAMGLRDPASATYEHRDRPYVLACDRGVFGNSTIAEFWVAEVWVNARNGYGGYTGAQPYTVVFIRDEATGEPRLQAQVGQGGGRMVSASRICRRSSARSW